MLTENLKENVYKLKIKFTQVFVMILNSTIFKSWVKFFFLASLQPSQSMVVQKKIFLFFLYKFRRMLMMYSIPMEFLSGKINKNF